MSSVALRRTYAALAATLLAAALTSCSSSLLPQELLGGGSGSGSGSTTESPEGSASAAPATACGISGERVSALVDNVLAEVGTVQESALAGELPDLQALLAPFEGDVLSLTEGVTDPTLLAALESVQAAVLGFGEIPTPENLLGAPGYVQSLTKQLAQVSSATTELQQLCTTQ